MMKALALTAVVLASLGFSPAASQTVSYTLTCTSSATVCDAAPGTEGGVLAFTVPEFPTPDRWDGSLNGIWILNKVPATLDEVNPVTLTDVWFLNSPDGAMSFDYPDPSYAGGYVRYVLTGPQIFVGEWPDAAPQMLPGVFSVRAPAFGTNYELSGNLGSPAPIPEPAAWALMLSGLAMLGIVRRLALRSRALMAARRCLAAD